VRSTGCQSSCKQNRSSRHATRKNKIRSLTKLIKQAIEFAKLHTPGTGEWTGKPEAIGAEPRPKKARWRLPSGWRSSGTTKALLRLVTGCASDPLKRCLCQTIADLAHRFEASTCAEGIETIDDLRCLVGLGFDSGQGFLFAKLMPRKDFLNSLLSQTFEPLPAIQPRRVKA
jgi:hypothetical protein